MFLIDLYRESSVCRHSQVIRRNSPDRIIIRSFIAAGSRQTISHQYINEVIFSPLTRLQSGIYRDFFLARIIRSIYLNTAGSRIFPDMLIVVVSERWKGSVDELLEE